MIMIKDRVRLTARQEYAMDMIKEFVADKDAQIFILKGYAGTGKTTLIGSIVDYLFAQSSRIQLMAPTGRAAKVLRSKLPDYEASTIHKGIYLFSHIRIDESEGMLKYIFPLRSNSDRGIYIVDEASMVSSRKSDNEIYQFGTGVLIDDLLSYARVNFGGKIIFVGDPMQLPPVGDNCSVALSEAYFGRLGMKVYSYELTDIVRQGKDSRILSNATMIREMIRKKERNRLVLERKEGEVMDIGAMDVAESYCADPESSSAIVCFSNQQAADYNSAIRAILFPGMGRVTVGDKLMVVCNSYYGERELLNGDMITVVDVSDKTVSQSAPVWVERGGKKEKIVITLDFRRISFQTEEGVVCERYIIETLLQNKLPSLTVDEMKALYINMVIRMREEKGLTNPKSKEFVKAVGVDPFYNALHVKYGYAFTCHKSQGGEWNTVYVDFTKRAGLDTDSLRWKYTAVTRASKKLWCVNLPDVTPMEALKITPIGKTSKVSGNALAFGDIKETPFHSQSSLPAVKCKYWSVVKNMDGTRYSIKKVTSKPWRDIYEVNAPTGTIRVDAVYNGAGLFTRYETEADDLELLGFFQNEESVKYKIEYHPSMESLKTLHHRMISLCDECDILVTNVVEERYQLVYYMKASGNYAAITFYFDGKGFINYAAPLSDIGEADIKLSRLIEELTK